MGSSGEWVICWLLTFLWAPSLTHCLKRCYPTRVYSGSSGTRTDIWTRKGQCPLVFIPPQRALNFIYHGRGNNLIRKQRASIHSNGLAICWPTRLTTVVALERRNLEEMHVEEKGTQTALSGGTNMSWGMEPAQEESGKSWPRMLTQCHIHPSLVSWRPASLLSETWWNPRLGNRGLYLFIYKIWWLIRKYYIMYTS